MAASKSPTQRSLEYLRKQGYTVQVTERWNPYARVRVDLFGFIDMVAVKDKETLGVQTTSKVNITTRMKKILTLPEAKTWLGAGNRIIVHGWGSSNKAGIKRWVVDSREITLLDFTN